jgi:ParB-like chromosome segregation protein Spo0J
MSEIEGGFEDLLRSSDAPPVPIREGLPPSYRMRASSHYVEQLDSESFSSPIRYLDAKAIEVRGDDPLISEAFVESIRRHGVLQPLLVQGRNGRHRLIAGRKRLTAALAAGLREVPCLVQRVGEREAALLADATNLAAVDPAAAPEPEPTAPPPEPARSVQADAALAQCLSSLASSSGLLSADGSLAAAVAIDLVKAESARALQLLIAARVLRADAPLSRATVLASVLAERVARTTAAERRLRGIDLTVCQGESGDMTADADEELLASAVCALVMAAGTLVDGGRERRIILTWGASEPDAVEFRVSQDGATLPPHRLARLFEGDALDGRDRTAMNAMLQAAGRIAEMLGGRAVAASTERGTSFSMVVPATAGRVRA